jgi:hypothetical protein
VVANLISRRDALALVTLLPVLALATGCDAPTTGLNKVKRIVVAVAKKVFKVVGVGIDLVELAVEIRAIIDGKEETIQTHITREEAEALKNGGQLVIRGEDGKEFPVEYRTK